MNKKEARRKKHEAEKKRSRDILDSAVIGGDDDNEEFNDVIEGGEEEETLLGNLAPVKQIAAIPWHRIPPLPMEQFPLNMPCSPGDWILKLFEETAKKDHDIIGLLPVPNFDTKMPTQKDVLSNRIGMGVQVREVKKTDANTAIINLYGLARFEIIDMAHNKGNYLIFNVRWFEDEIEPDEVLEPLYKENLRIVERIAKMVGDNLKMYFNASEQMKYSRLTAHYGSFFLMHTPFDDWFTFEERHTLLKMTSTAERLRRVNERAEKMFPSMERKYTAERRAKNN